MLFPSHLFRTMPPSKEPDPKTPSWVLIEKKPLKKRGPKPKPLKDRPYKPSKPIVRPQRSYSKKKKEEVIMWLIHHRVEVRGVLCKPSTREAAANFKIPQSTINNWMKTYCESYVEDESEGNPPASWNGGHMISKRPLSSGGDDRASAM